MNQVDKLNEIWWECVELLHKHNPKVKSEYSDKWGYSLSKDVRRILDFNYTELMTEPGDGWILIDDGGYTYDLGVLSTDELCTLTDILLN